MTELIRDPDFLDSALWDITTGSGTASISDGKLTLVDWSGTIDAVDMDDPVVGQTVNYVIVVESASGGGIIRCGGLGSEQFPDQDVMWGTGLGAGTFSFTDEFETTDTLRIRNLVSKLSCVISKISIYTGTRHHEGKSPDPVHEDPIKKKLKELGFKEDRDLGKELHDCVHEDKRHIDGWREQAMECYNFEAGDQWDDDDKAVMEATGRVPAVYNRVQRTVNAIAGLEIQNRQEVRYLPREQQDTGLNELLSGAAKWVRDECDAEDEESDSFRDLVICGMGWTETRMDYEMDMEGSIVVDRVDPMEMGWDHTAKKKNIDDARRVWRVREYPVHEARQRWPGADFTGKTFWNDEEDLEHNADDAWKYENDQIGYTGSKKQIQVIHLQFFEVRYIHLVAGEGGQRLLEFDEEQYEKIQDYVEKSGLSHEVIGKREYFTAFMSGEEILEIAPLSCRSFTLRPMTGIRDRNKNYWTGIVKCMIDPQRGENTFRSIIISILRSNAKGGLLAETGAFQNVRQAEDQWSSPDSITWLNDGGLQKIQEKGQTQYPQGFDRLMQNAQEAVPEVTGVSMEMLGLAGATNQVGIIEASRKQSGISILGPYFDGLRRYRKEQGRVLAHYIKTYISDGRLIRIMGPVGQQYIPLLKQPDNLKYDVIVDDAPSSPNQKMQAYAVMMEILPQLTAMGLKPPAETLDLLPLPSPFIEAWKKQLQQPDPEAEQAKKLALMDKDQEIKESRSKEALNYAKVQSEGVKPVVEIEKAKQAKAKAELDAFKTGADVANPNRGNL